MSAPDRTSITRNNSSERLQRFNLELFDKPLEQWTDTETELCIRRTIVSGRDIACRLERSDPIYNDTEYSNFKLGTLKPYQVENATTYDINTDA